MDLTGRISTAGTQPVLYLSGEIDLSTSPVLRDLLTRLVHDHARATVRVDLDGITTLDDTGLGVLLGAAATARDLGGELQVISSPGRVRDRLATTRVDRAITVVGSASEQP
jgi:anti-sigma B factor antagonist